MYQFGFIGMGNMGSAMLKGCLSVFPANTLAFSRKDAAKGEALSLETGAVIGLTVTAHVPNNPDTLFLLSNLSFTTAF